MHQAVPYEALKPRTARIAPKNPVFCSCEFKDRTRDETTAIRIREAGIPSWAQGLRGRGFHGGRFGDFHGRGRFFGPGFGFYGYGYPWWDWDYPYYYPYPYYDYDAYYGNRYYGNRYYGNRYYGNPYYGNGYPR